MTTPSLVDTLLHLTLRSLISCVWTEKKHGHYEEMPLIIGFVCILDHEARLIMAIHFK